MNSISRPAPPEIIPDTAPFDAEQRAWLNGFLAGFLSVEEVADAVPAAEQEDDGAPWHDQSLAIDDRMKLAEGRPLNRRLMAAMAQQDCGQCGYQCETYADALAGGREKQLNLCVPGGKATARMLKALYREVGDSDPETADKPAPSKPDASRDNPLTASFVRAVRLTGEGSARLTNHIEFAFEPGTLEYAVGDSLGVWATNDPTLADAIVAALGATGDAEVGDGNGRSRTLKDALIEDVSLSPAPDALFELLAGIASGAVEREKLFAMAAGRDPDGDLETLDVLAALEKFPHLAPAPKALIEALETLQPRLYSISSSPRVEPTRVALTVDAVRYEVGGRLRKGLASNFLAERVARGAAVPVYIQKAHGFALPADGATPIVMVGPGTGVAPFRAFLQERLARKAVGGSWLFFGHRHEKSEFFYRDEFEGFLANGTLTRLSTAWSRDGAEKIYVQDRMREAGAALFRWLADGAHFYVCGDAGRMAADVDRALRDIVADHGGMSAERADAYIDRLIETGRYQRDVY
jgi:sulfite reductase (NADPH) flavoprotein alpha-component